MFVPQSKWTGLLVDAAPWPDAVADPTRPLDADVAKLSPAETTDPASLAEMAFDPPVGVAATLGAVARDVTNVLPGRND